jgi:hypothetical protein
MKLWLIVRAPNGNESQYELLADQDTVVITATRPTGMYDVELWNTIPYPSANGGSPNGRCWIKLYEGVAFACTGTGACATCGYEVKGKTPTQKYNLSARVDPLCSGYVDPNSGSYTPDTPVTVNAYARAGWKFAYWSGDAIATIRQSST